MLREAAKKSFFSVLTPPPLELSGHISFEIFFSSFRPPLLVAGPLKKGFFCGFPCASYAMSNI